MSFSHVRGAGGAETWVSEVKRATSVSEMGPGPAGRVEVIGRLTVDDQVDAERLVVLLDPEADRAVEAPDQQCGHPEREGERRERRQRLLAELVEAAAVEQAVDADDV